MVLRTRWPGQISSRLYLRFREIPLFHGGSSNPTSLAFLPGGPLLPCHGSRGRRAAPFRHPGRCGESQADGCVRRKGTSQSGRGAKETWGRGCWRYSRQRPRSLQLDIMINVFNVLGFTWMMNGSWENLVKLLFFCWEKDGNKHGLLGIDDFYKGLKTNYKSSWWFQIYIPKDPNSPNTSLE